MRTNVTKNNNKKNKNNINGDKSIGNSNIAGSNVDDKSISDENVGGSGMLSNSNKNIGMSITIEKSCNLSATMNNNDEEYEYA